LFFFFKRLEPMPADNRILDDLAKLMSNAAGAAQGMKEEASSVLRAQAEKIIDDLDLVSRDEFNAVQAMAQKARMENDALTLRIEALEAKL
jgi:BMFP domain-containing protein YqiC